MQIKIGSQKNSLDMGLREIESKDESISAQRSQILSFIYQELDLEHNLERIEFD